MGEFLTVLSQVPSAIIGPGNGVAKACGAIGLIGGVIAGGKMMEGYKDKGSFSFPMKMIAKKY